MMHSTQTSEDITFIHNGDPRGGAVKIHIRNQPGVCVHHVEGADQYWEVGIPFDELAQFVLRQYANERIEQIESAGSADELAMVLLR